MSLSAGRKGVSSNQVDSLGKIKGIDIPIASPTKAGLVKPVSKTAGMTQDVGIDSNGKLYTASGSSGTIIKILDNCPGTLSTDYDLSSGLSNFDLILIEATVPYSAENPNLLSSIHVVSMCEVGTKLNVFNEASAGGFVVKSNTVLTGGGHNFQGATPTFYVYGIKL